MLIAARSQLKSSAHANVDGLTVGQHRARRLIPLAVPDVKRFEAPGEAAPIAEARPHPDLIDDSAPIIVYRYEHFGVGGEIERAVGGQVRSIQRIGHREAVAESPRIGDRVVTVVPVLIFEAEQVPTCKRRRGRFSRSAPRPAA